MVAEKLLLAIDNPDITLTEEELKILKNGDLGKASLGFEELLNLRIPTCIL